MTTKNGEIANRHKGVETIDASTGEVNTILMPIVTLEHLGYNVEDGVPVRVVVDSVSAGAWWAGR
jgi:hypothetical protein